MFSALVSKAPTVKITIEDDQIIVHPETIPGQPSQDPIVRGTVLLELATPRAVNKVRVVFEGLCDAFGGTGYPYESSTTLHDVLETDLKGEVLAKGSHALNFSFRVPSSTTCSQRCNFGRVRHYVKATVDFAGAFQPSVSSAPVMVWLAANPNPPGEPLGTQIFMHHDSDDLGPVAVTVSSPHLTIASLLNVKVDFLAPNSSATITSIQGVINQQFTIKYDDPTVVATPPEERHMLAKVGRTAHPRPFSEPNATHADTTRPLTGAAPSTGTPSTSSSAASSLFAPSASNSPATSFNSASLSASGSGSRSGLFPPSPQPCENVIKSKYPGVNGEVVIGDDKPLARVVPGEEYSYSRVMRVPDDDYVRATTLEGSEGRIRVCHKFTVEVTYKVDGDDKGEKMLRLSKALTITSCCCIADRIYLPSYERSAPKTVVVPLDQRCFCNMSLKEMLDRDLEPLQRAGEITVDPGVAGIALAVGADRENKTPAVGEIERWRAGGGEGRRGSAEGI